MGVFLELSCFFHDPADVGNLMSGSSAFSKTRTKLLEVMEFQSSYFKSWKMMLWKCSTQYASKFGKFSSDYRTGKRSVFIPIPKKGNAKQCSNYCTIPLISHASKVMLKILQARLQQYLNYELPDVQAGFRKGKGTRDQIANIRWIMEKAREFRKTSISPLWLCQSLWITINWKILREKGIPDHLTCLLRNLYAG